MPGSAIQIWTNEKSNSFFEMNVDPLSVVGRVAQLVELKAKPELNDFYVEISGYDPKNSRYTVRTLSSPVLSPSSATMSVKLLNLKLMPCFASLQPTAQVLDGSAFGPHWVGDAAIFDFSDSRVADEDETIVIRSTCCIRGARKQSCDPTTRFDAAVIIHSTQPDLFVEFQDIHFAGRKQEICVGCVQAEQTWSLEDNCVFDDNEMAGLVVTAGGHATLLNCVIRGGKYGVRVGKGGHAVLRHCVISHVAIYGVEMYHGDTSLEMLNCTVGPSQSAGVFINKGGEALIRECLILDCGIAGIGIEGSRHTTLDACTFRNCVVAGVLMHTGNITLVMTSCHMQNIHKATFSIGRGVTGSVDITCDPADHCCRQFHHKFGSRCKVVLHGRELPPEEYTTPYDTKFIDKMEVEKSKKNMYLLHQTKALKKAGTGNVECFNCHTIEPEDVKFKLCSKCQAVCYCSRECQAHHWKVHKKDCKREEIV